MKRICFESHQNSLRCQMLGDAVVTHAFQHRRVYHFSQETSIQQLPNIDRQYRKINSDLRGLDVLQAISFTPVSPSGIGMLRLKEESLAVQFSSKNIFASFKSLWIMIRYSFCNFLSDLQSYFPRKWPCGSFPCTSYTVESSILRVFTHENGMRKL
ncbi:unnamed protein product [Thlaspi arvense]|uniref:Uncharacterized protein n=1 Tax=Thlaspi arvense TaxID=13288 RepID=A0AAU9SH47_THLAR|nr:unnamed protein product [Thlaspi arvense]